MITKEQYTEAIIQKDNAEKIIHQYFVEKEERFQKRLKENPIFIDEELFYSRYERCPCGAGLAYPKECGGFHYWDCSDILKGKENKQVKHTAQLPFVMYEIKGERENETTRPK